MNKDKISRITLINRLKTMLRKYLHQEIKVAQYFQKDFFHIITSFRPFKNSITYTGVHHFKRSTTTCEWHGPIHNAKIWLDSSLQPELFKQWFWSCQSQWAPSGSSSFQVEEPRWRFNQTRTIDWSYLCPSITGVDVFYFSPSTQCQKKHPGCQNLTYRY